MFFFSVALPLLHLAAITCQGLTTPSMPSWWNQWKQVSSFSSPFTQEGESAAFGKLTSKGNLLIAKGGRLRVEYEKGMLLLCNGKQLTQYDPSTRTAQMHDLEDISTEWPLLHILIDPATITQVFHVNVQDGGMIRLSPKKPNLPEITMEGKGSFLHKASWIDGTGAKQVLTLTAPKAPKDPGNGPFVFIPPTGTKWIQ